MRRSATSRSDMIAMLDTNTRCVHGEVLAFPCYQLPLESWPLKRDPFFAPNAFDSPLAVFKLNQRKHGRRTHDTL